MADSKKNEIELCIEIYTVIDMLYLLVCVLKGKIPDSSRIDGMDLEKIYQLSNFHSVAAMIGDVLESAKVIGIPKEYQGIKAVSVQKNILHDLERKRLFSYMEERGIWYMPLKGILLKELYPRIGQRQMADNDILFDKSYREEVRNWFLEHGYQLIDIEENHHDVYKKPPFLYFEMHTSLFKKKQQAVFGEEYNEIWYEYYDNLKERLIKDSENQYGYHFSDEDFYVYFMTHGFKHYNRGGIGIRFLLDMYVFLEKKQNEMNWEYIQTELRCLKVRDFEETCRQLVLKLFADVNNLKPEKLSENEKEMLLFFAGSGTHGTFQNSISRGIKKSEKSGKNGKFGYCLSRLFPDEEFMKVNYPFCGKHKYLIPFGWMYRIGKSICDHPGKILEELLILVKINV